MKKETEEAEKSTNYLFSLIIQLGFVIVSFVINVVEAQRIEFTKKKERGYAHMYDIEHYIFLHDRTLVEN